MQTFEFLFRVIFEKKFNNKMKIPNVIRTLYYRYEYT